MGRNQAMSVSGEQGTSTKVPVLGHSKSPRGVVVGDEDPGGYLENRDKDLPEIAGVV